MAMAGVWRFFVIIIPTPVFGFDWGVAIRLYCFNVTALNLGYFVLVKRKTCYDFDVFFLGGGGLFWSRGVSGFFSMGGTTLRLRQNAGRKKQKKHP